MKDMTCRVSFQCTSLLPPGHVVGVVGNIEGLGNWNAGKALLLKQRDFVQQMDWVGSVSAKRGDCIEYRYFTAQKLVVRDSSVVEKLLVKSWEVHLSPRSIAVPDKESFQVNDGEFGSKNSEMAAVDRGWLSEHYEVRCSISSPKSCPCLEFASSSTQYSGLNLRIQPKACSAVISSKVTVISPFNYEEYADEEKYLITLPIPEEDHTDFIVETYDPKELFLQFHISDDKGTAIGVGVLSCRSFTTSKAIAKIPILDLQFSVIGTMRVPHLLIKPFSSSLSMERCFTKHWKPKPMVHVGHRGSGNSFKAKKLANKFENTISSFIEASKSIASFVEFDVHLSKDEVAVVYHDLTVCIPAKKKGSSNESNLVEIPVHLFTLNELQSLLMTHRSRKITSRPLDYDVNDPEERAQPFPTLKRVFEEVPASTGFNLELKWPNLDENLEYEDGLKHYFDSNFFVDSILSVVFKCAKSRKIIFSCFDVDICIMLRRKQNLYPVLFLTNGDTKHYTPMLDVREATNKMAIGTAKAEGFLGIDTLDKDVYKTPDIVKKVHDAGLLFACYGDDITDRLEDIKNSGADIAIYDRVYDVKL